MNQQRTTEWTGGHRDKKKWHFMCFLTTNISSITQPITLQPILFERLNWISIHFLNLNHILTEITIKIYGRQGNSEFWWTLDWWLIMLWSSWMFRDRLRGLSNYATNWIKPKLIRKIESELCNKSIVKNPNRQFVSENYQPKNSLPLY